jgi:hypothetical protein
MRRYPIFVILIGICVVQLIKISGGNNMREVQFDIGKNIITVAKASGAAGYSVQNVDGLLMYDANGLSPDVPVRYNRPGYEILFAPTFSLTLYADKKIDNDLSVHTAALQASTRTIKSHAAAQDFVRKIILQFKKGKWQRYIDTLCPAVTGRSSILNESGQVAQIGACALDPDYQLSEEEWVQLMPSTQNYKWAGDGVLAKLTITYNDFGRGIEYSIDLDFDDLELKIKRDEENYLHELAEGDAKGWKSTEKRREYIAEMKARIKILEKNASLRGDRVILVR